MKREKIINAITSADAEDSYQDDNKLWDTIIEPKRHLLDIDLKELWNYRDLLIMFVHRDVVTIYKQTILGPVWYVLQPILMTGMFTLVFGNIAGIETDGLPKVLFYFSGIIIWNYFSESFNQTSKTFKENAQVFGKVYFPRLIMPLAKVTSGLIKFGIQFVFFLGVFFWYFFRNPEIDPNFYILLLPVFVLLMGMLGLGAGIIFTSLTAKYRDLTFLLQFGIQLLMYGTPVIYPISTVEGKLRTVLMANPMTPVLEGFKYAFLGTGTFELWHLLYSFGFASVLLITGIIIFNKTEQNFMDTV